MEKLIMITIFFLILLIIQYQDRKKIILESYKSTPHSIVYVMLFIAMLILFRSNSTENNIQLFIFAFFVLNFGLRKEGLGKNQFIKSGYVFSSEYNKYKIIEIKPYLDKNSQIKFKKSDTDNGISMMLVNPPQQVFDFLKKNVETDMIIDIEE